MVHAVDEVDVDRARPAPQRLRAGGAPAEGVRGGIVHAQVGLGLHDAGGQRAPAEAADEDLPEQGGARPPWPAAPGGR